MAQTVANLASVLKDAWTSDKMAKQFYDENPLLEWFKQYTATMMGQQAQVPIYKAIGGGQTSTGPAGGVLNPADAAKVDQALYTMAYLWRQINIETAVLNQADSSMQSVIQGKNFEISNAVAGIARDASRMLANNGDGFIAQCTTTTTSTTVQLLPAASGGVGYDAVVMQWLQPGMVVDIGTAGDSDAIVTGATITDVVEDPVTPGIIINSSVSTTSSHFVSIANPNSTTVTNTEINGLRNMFGSATSIVGGINPATAGESFWKPASVDATTTSLSLDLMLNLNKFVWRKTGKPLSTVVTSGKQFTNFYSLLQNQVRFAGDQGLGAGGIKNMNGLSWNGMGLNAWPDIVEKELYFLSQDDVLRITGSIKQPTWTSELEGGGAGLRWAQGTTAFVEGIVFPLQTGTQRRNSAASATNLVA
jgi:hypothetical protein